MINSIVLCWLGFKYQRFKGVCKMAENDQILFDRVDSMECPSCHAEIDVSALPPFSAAACPNCNAALTVPARLANYRLLSCLGSGGMGSVYRAYDETLDRVVAIKVMLRKLGEQPEFLASFRREAQAAAKLNHPNIAQIYSFGEENGQPYIVMEFVPGKHLDTMMEDPEMLSQPMIMKIGMDIADGLQLAAASNLIHGDIKPENILLDDRGIAKLVDFGIASTPDSASTEIWGTPYYISPEKIKREKVDFRSDIYCLGATLYHAIAKQPPFDGKDAMEVVRARLEGPPRPIRELRPDVDPEVEAIIDRMLQVEPSKRYPTYGSLMSDIRQYLSRVQPQQITAGAGAASKRIVIKGRGAATRAKMQAAEATGAITSTSLGQPTPSETQANQSTTGSHIRITKSKKPIHVATTPIVDEEDPEVLARQKAREIKKILYSIIGVVVFLILGVVGVFVGLNLKSKNDAQQKSEAIASQDDSFRSLFAKCATIASTKGQIYELADQADAIVKEAVAAIEAEFGDEFTARITEEVPEPVEETEEPPAEEESKEGEATDGEVADKDAEAKEGAEQESDKETEGEVTEEASDSEAKEETEAADEESDTESPEAEPKEDDSSEGETAADASAEEVAPEALEGLPGIAREIYVMLAPVRWARAKADKAQNSVNEAYIKATEQTNINVNASVKEIQHAVGVHISAFDEAKGIAEKQADALAEVISPLPSLLKDAKAKASEIDAEIKKLALERERVAAEEKAAEEARLAQEKKEAEEAARQAAEEAEIAQVRAIIPSNIDKLMAHQYDSVLREFDKLNKTLTFKSAKKAYKAEYRRVEGLRDLKAFLIARLSSEDQFTHAKNKWKILSVDNRIVEVLPPKKGASPVRIKWSELKPLEQIVPITLYYLFDADKARDIPLRERVANYINAAIYFMTFAGDNESAKNMAKTFAERAMTDMPSKRNEVVETLYDLEFNAQ